MKVTIETTDEATLSALQPFIAAATKYDGHLNWSYTQGQHHTNDDIRHRERLREILTELNAGDLFIIGAGSSHVWISLNPINWADHPIASRVILITD